MPSDIEVPTWVKVKWLAGSPAALVFVVPVVVVELIEKVRRNVGTSIAGAAKSVPTARFTAPGIRSFHMVKSELAN
jgi:hypothetical protein